MLKIQSVFGPTEEQSGRDNEKEESLIVQNDFLHLQSLQMKQDKVCNGRGVILLNED